MKEISCLLPKENLIYLGDTANLPYGEKSADAIKRYTLENSKFLASQNIKLLIIACHTASSQALQTVQQTLPIPVLGVIDAGLQQLALIQKKSHIAVLGTTSTIQSGIYQSLIRKSHPNTKIYPIACPLFVPLIEEQLFEHESVSLIADHYLKALETEQIDTALLACTHYPLIRPAIQKALGAKVILIEPAKTVATQTLEWLKNHNLLNTQTTKPKYQFYTTDSSEKFSRLARVFFNNETKFLMPINIEKNKNP